jgi:MoxR-like ATPase
MSQAPALQVVQPSAAVLLSGAVDLQARFENLRNAVNAVCLERDEETECALLALISRTHMFQLGPPGVAKTMLFAELTKRIEGAKQFKLLMTRFTSERQIFGPEDIVALKNGHQKRRTTGFLSEADLGCLEELWKTGAVANSMLSIANERKYEEDGMQYDVPLSCLFVTSNELPADDTYAAIYDRILQRRFVKPPQDRANRIAIYDMRAKGTVVDAPPIEITWDEIKAAQAEARKVVVPASVLEIIDDVVLHCQEKNIDTSTRRANDAVVLVQAASWLDRRTEAQISDAQVLTNVLWQDPDQIGDVEKIVLSMVNPDHAEVLKVVQDIGTLTNDVDAAVKETNPTRRAAGGAEIQKKLVKNIKALRAFEGKQLSPRTRTLLNKGQLAIVSASERVLIEIQNIPEEIAKANSAAILKQN